ncbi:MAG: hypothetical protein HKN25_12380 [Pyrinomonadaceae bacterium]|nr:hypothetical protein [Pyrinomonadaceae bacterium]
MIANIVNEFNKGIELISALDDKAFSEPVKGAGSIGAHFRHNMDFACSFLNGLETGTINYSDRERDLRVESNRDYAREQIRFLIKRFEGLSEDKYNERVLVVSEIEERISHESTISRELEFLHSHTVHHYAVIAEKLKIWNFAVDFSFGVAPSTLKYWSEEKAESKVA